MLRLGKLSTRIAFAFPSWKEMEAFLSRSKNAVEAQQSAPAESEKDIDGLLEEEPSTDLKLAILHSLHPETDSSTLLDLLVVENGLVERVLEVLASKALTSTPRKRSAMSIGYQSSIAQFGRDTASESQILTKRRALTKKGQTLHLFAPEDVEKHTPCSIVHNFLPKEEAEDLLRELLGEAPTFEKATFKIFDNVVQSPHSACFYVENLEEEIKQKNEYLYNGSSLEDVRQLTPQMRKVSPKVEAAVNDEIHRRIQTFNPHGQKLQYQQPGPWVPNAAFVNCYKGGAESVGYHSDQLTYLGPRAVIGSISLGVASNAVPL
ncbi:uncharacterized protein KY384_007040 [Bacidia gigantensis]|uniref:uncharacterized protein n=1 Tax=Bacidia gigantensis TaxID=2732470 RepID=UPI001D05C071|nr:uncharacterized protein KY384_007040 [Bacidia gigantensis]KAG8528124.1 hypothetical protein KY384_007040 [Bacidia gigantensis]